MSQEISRDVSSCLYATLHDGIRLVAILIVVVYASARNKLCLRLHPKSKIA